MCLSYFWIFELGRFYQWLGIIWVSTVYIHIINSIFIMHSNLLPTICIEMLLRLMNLMKHQSIIAILLGNDVHRAKQESEIYKIRLANWSRELSILFVLVLAWQHAYRNMRYSARCKILKLLHTEVSSLTPRS